VKKICLVADAFLNEFLGLKPGSVLPLLFPFEKHLIDGS
jgi:hypothetical protein